MAVPVSYYRMLNELKIKYCNVTYASPLIAIGSVVFVVVVHLAIYVAISLNNTNISKIN
jgi:hypothetical protein